jgi:hypothetical protein
MKRARVSGAEEHAQLSRGDTSEATPQQQTATNVEPSVNGYYQDQPLGMYQWAAVRSVDEEDMMAAAAKAAEDAAKAREEAELKKAAEWVDSDPEDEESSKPAALPSSVSPETARLLLIKYNRGKDLPRSQYRGVSWDRRMDMWRVKVNAVHSK